MTTHIHDTPVILSNDIFESYSIIVTGYAECEKYRMKTQYFLCGCIYRAEINCEGEDIVWSKQEPCEDHLYSQLV